MITVRYATVNGVTAMATVGVVALKPVLNKPSVSPILTICLFHARPIPHLLRNGRVGLWPILRRLDPRGESDLGCTIRTIVLGEKMMKMGGSLPLYVDDE